MGLPGELKVLIEVVLAWRPEQLVVVGKVRVVA